MIADPKEFRSLAMQLAEIGYIPVFGEMNENLDEIVVECILKCIQKKVKKVTFLINSGGGFNNTYSAIVAAMYEARLADTCFDGLVMGKACSNAFMLLQHCDKRSATRDSMLMFHWGSQKLGNSELSALIAGETWPIEHAKRVEMVTAEIVSDRSGISVEQLISFALYERWFVAEEALAMKFIDEIVQDLPQKVKAGLTSSTNKSKKRK